MELTDGAAGRGDAGIEHCRRFERLGFRQRQRLERRDDRRGRNRRRRLGQQAGEALAHLRRPPG